MEMVVVVIVAALGGLVAFFNLRGRYRRRRALLGYDSGTGRTAEDAARGDRADHGASDGGGGGD